jgi:hypothetical protein
MRDYRGDMTAVLERERQWQPHVEQSRKHPVGAQAGAVPGCSASYDGSM